MPALNFQKRFADAVESGRKRQTIRATRKLPIRPGDTLYLYTGLRRPGARLLRTEICTLTMHIAICRTPMRDEVFIDGEPTSWNGVRFDRIARQDGFDNAKELLDWIERTHGLAPGKPFKGQVIRW